ncbi:MAG: sugar ABC transporter permease, partial [Acetobacteraceae bacterium]
GAAGGALDPPPALAGESALTLAAPEPRAAPRSASEMVSEQVEAPPEVSRAPAMSYGQALWSRIAAGQSGVLPVLLGAILIAIIFQSQNAKFLSAGNLVNLMVQGAVFMLIGMAEVFILLLGEIDLSLGYVAGIGGVIVTELVTPGQNWGWGAAIIVALIITSFLGLVQGSLITRLRLPSFVVTLAGLLGFQGIMIALLGTGGTIPIRNEVINGLANGTLSRAGAWILMAIVVVLFALITIVRDRRRRASGLSASPRFVVTLKIVVAAGAGIGIVLICNTNRGVPAFPFSGMPWVIPIVFAVLIAWTFLLGRTRFGRYIYAIGGNAEAARRTGIDLAWIRTLAFTLAGLTAGIGGIIYASRLRSMSTSFDGGTIVLYVVATAVIGGTSLFGGRGHPLHAVIGGIVIAGIVNGMALLGLSASVQLMATAVVLLASITVDVVVRRRGATAR